MPLPCRAVPLDFWISKTATLTIRSTESTMSAVVKLIFTLVLMLTESDSIISLSLAPCDFTHKLAARSSLTCLKKMFKLNSRHKCQFKIQKETNMKSNYLHFELVLKVMCSGRGVKLIQYNIDSCHLIFHILDVKCTIDFLWFSDVSRTIIWDAGRLEFTVFLSNH